MLWNYVATVLKIGVGVIILPLILRKFSYETVAIWTIFTSINTMVTLLDLGFNPTFARNISYVMSGVSKLNVIGHQTVGDEGNIIDYGLFKGLIGAMRWFYSRMALILFALLSTAGTYYIYVILRNYSSSRYDVYISWFILCAINTYSLYTYYYDALMLGMGLVGRANQILIVANTAYLAVAIVMVLLDFNIIAIVCAQAVMVLIKRILSHRVIYTKEFRWILTRVAASSRKKLIKLILPNALKVGASGVSGFLCTRCSVIIGALFLSLYDVGAYGITMQLVTIIAGMANVYIATYHPKIAQCYINNDIITIKQIYIKSCLMVVNVYCICGLGLILLGNEVFHLIKSNTPLLSIHFIATALLFSALSTNHAIAGQIIVQRNEVPFYKSDLINGLATLLLLFVLFKTTNLGVWCMILAPGIIMACYSNWKWPFVVFKELNLNYRDIEHCLVFYKK